MTATRTLLACTIVILALIALVATAQRPSCRSVTRRPVPSSLPPAEDLAPVAQLVPPKASARSCAPHATRECDGGDAWWFDGCGRREERIDTCDDALCEDGRCVPSQGPPCPANLSEGGRCDGDVLRYCDSGVLREVNCAASGDRCLREPDGDSACVSVSPPCSSRASACLDEHVAHLCEHGRWRIVICSLGSRCQAANGSLRCARAATERCDRVAPDGGSEDVVDLPVVAFVVTDDRGRTAESEVRVRAAMEAAAASFALPQHNTGIRLRLREVRSIVRPAWFAAGQRTINDAMFDPELHPLPGTAFFVPIVFTKEITIKSKRTPGVATRHGSCLDASLQSSQKLPVLDSGAVFIARQRNPTTVAHEVGHFLGLCHTHEPDSLVPEITVDETGAAVAAPATCAACGRTGDGVCDTPVDPGPESCLLDAARCAAACAAGAEPDPANLMSYFIPCRRYFSGEQARNMRSYLNRRDVVGGGR